MIALSAQAVAFWILAPLAIAGAAGMILSRKPVHSALSLAGMMICLGCLYASLDAPFLFVSQIIVYTGAVMMLFLFTMMITGIDSVDSVVETVKGHRFLSVLIVAAFALIVIALVGNGIVTVSAGFDTTLNDGNIPQLAQLIFGPYVFAFLATSALILVGAMAAIILAHGERLTKPQSQKERTIAKIRSFVAGESNPGPLPGSGVYARHNSIEYPGLLPDGSVAKESVSPTLAVRGAAVVVNDSLRSVHSAALTSFAEARDELDGTDHASAIAEALDDSTSASAQIEASSSEVNE